MASRTLIMHQFIKLDIPSSSEDYFLTTLDESDAEAMLGIFSVEELNNRLPRAPWPYTLESAQTWLAKELPSGAHLLSLPTVAERHDAFFSSQDHVNRIPLQAIRHLSPTGPFIGSFALTYRFDPQQPNIKEVEVGYYLHPSHQGKRIMLAAAKAALAWAREEFGITEVCGKADYSNVRSGRLMERIVCETCVGGEGGVRRGDGVYMCPGEKVGRPGAGEVERGCWTWAWMI